MLFGIVAQRYCLVTWGKAKVQRGIVARGKGTVKSSNAKV